MIKLITSQSGRKNADGILYQMSFDSASACEKYNINTHSFKVEFDAETCSLKLVSTTSAMNDQGFTADNRVECTDAEAVRAKYVDTLKKARYTVVTYKNMSDHKHFALKLARGGDVSAELMSKESCKFYSVIIPTANGAGFRDYVSGKPSNSSIYPFWSNVFEKEEYRPGDEL